MLEHVRTNRPLAAAVFVFLLATVVISAALIFEHALGYEPCELCYLQRKPWYFAISFGLLLVVFATKGEGTLVRYGLYLLAAVMMVSAGLGVWHAGIEWKFWPGPASCSGGDPMALGGLPDLNRRVVLCDEAPLRILGLSFAGWNVVASVIAAAVALWGALAASRRG